MLPHPSVALHSFLWQCDVRSRKELLANRHIEKTFRALPTSSRPRWPRAGRPSRTGRSSPPRLEAASTSGRSRSSSTPPAPVSNWSNGTSRGSKRGKLVGASVKPCAPGCTATSSAANHARFAFLDPRARDFWIDWERAANDTVGVLRGEAGRNPYDKSLSALVGELSMRSEDFRTRWAAQNVYLHRNGTKLINHPIVGRLELMCDALRADRRYRADDAREHRCARQLQRRRANPAGQLGGTLEQAERTSATEGPHPG